MKYTDMPTISSTVVTREFLEVCCLKAFLVAIHCSHEAWPGLLEDLRKVGKVLQTLKESTVWGYKYLSNYIELMFSI